MVKCFNILAFNNCSVEHPDALKNFKQFVKVTTFTRTQQTLAPFTVPVYSCLSGSCIYGDTWDVR